MTTLLFVLFLSVMLYFGYQHFTKIETGLGRRKPGNPHPHKLVRKCEICNIKLKQQVVADANDEVACIVCRPTED